MHRYLSITAHPYTDFQLDSSSMQFVIHVHLIMSAYSGQVYLLMTLTTDSFGFLSNLQSSKISVLHCYLFFVSGDRILSVTIGFNNIAYEDALTILSYAAPYPMTLRLVRGSDLPNTTSTSPTAELSQPNSKIYHPVYRSQSLGGGSQNSKKQRNMPSRPGTSLSQVNYGE